MSIDTTSVSRWLGRAGGSLILLTIAAGPALAADWRFLPSLDLGVYREGNVGVTGSNGPSDEVARVGVTLDLEGDSQLTSTRLSYNPYREFYNEFSDLDYTAHNLSFGVAHKVSRRSSFNLDLGGYYTERQPIRSDRPDSTVTLVPRGKQIHGYLDITGRIGAGQRAFFDWGVDGDVTRFPDDDAGTISDTDSYGVSAGWGIELSPNSDLGIRARGERLGFESQATNDLATLEVFYDHDFSRTLNMALSAGAQNISSAGSDQTNPRFELTLDKTLRSGSTLEGGLRQEVTSAAGVSTPTLDRGAYVSLRPKGRAEHFSGQVTAYYWTREEADSTVAAVDIETLEALAALSWTPQGGRFALGGFYSYHDQKDAAGANPSIETSYSSGGIFFRWNFLGQRGAGS